MGVFSGTRINPDTAKLYVPDNSVLPMVTLVCEEGTCRAERTGMAGQLVRTVVRQGAKKARKERHHPEAPSYMLPVRRAPIWSMCR
jgi:hypothetical protein